MKTIYKKIQPQYLKEIEEGKKDFEIRKDDSNYEVGDILVLKEYGKFLNKFSSDMENMYTGKEITKRIKYILRNCPQYGLQEGYCILGLEDIETKVYVHIIRFKDVKHIKNIPFPTVFSSYDKLTEYEEQISKRNDIEVLQVQACVIDDGIKRIESEDK